MDDKAIQYPPLKPNKLIDFFLKSPINNAQFKELLRKYPQNVQMGQYTAPKIPKVVTENSKFSKKNDNHIRDFQEWCAEIT